MDRIRTLASIKQRKSENNNEKIIKRVNVKKVKMSKTIKTKKLKGQCRISKMSKRKENS
jgi:hypothetical protein